MWHGKHMSETMNKHATIEELFEATFVCDPSIVYILRTNRKSLSVMSQGSKSMVSKS
jgi:hypothetical protein